MTFRTKPPSTYISPTPKEIQDVAKDIGIEYYSNHLATDIANIAAGGNVIPSTKWKHRIIQQMKPKKYGKRRWVYSTYDAYGYMNGKEWTEDLQKAKEAEAYTSIKVHENVCQFLRTLDFSNVPGKTPLQKAMTLIHTMQINTKGYRNSPQDEESDQRDVRAFQGNDPTSYAEEINETFESIESLDPEEQFLMLGAGEGSNQEIDTRKVKLAIDMTNGKKIWLKVSRKLETLSKIKVSKYMETKEDPHGTDIQQRAIKNFSEIQKIPKTEWLLPETYRNYKIATRAIQVKERITKTHKQQLLYLLIDCSGSMAGERSCKAGGVLMNRLKAVVKGDAQIYVRFFDTQLSEKEYFAGSAKEAKSLIEMFEKKEFNGGGTNISGCIEKSIERINEITKSKSLTRPELVITTDGEDSVARLKRKDFGETRLHSIIVENNNPNLLKLARQTGGVGIEKI